MAAQEWRDLSAAFAQYTGRLDRVRSHHINSQELREQTRQVAQMYFRGVRPLLAQYPIDDLIEPVTSAFQSLIELSEGRNLTASYKKHTKAIRRLIPRITGQLELHLGADLSVSSSATDQKIISTLSGLLPSAAQSYQQAVTDLADPKRQSYRGSAHELREALREVLDHLAPDAEMKKAGVVVEKDRSKYTMKQKVRFIFKARDRSEKESASPEHAANAVEAVIADMTRSTYDHGALAAHNERGLKSIEQLKRYVDVVFHDLLEL